MKKFLSLFLALILVVGLLVPAVSAEPAETETKALVGIGDAKLCETPCKCPCKQGRAAW